MENKRYNSGIIFILGLLAVGILLWVFSPTTVFEFNGILEITHMLGQFLGIMGFILFSISLILSARFSFLENFFYGLNKVYEKHSQIGQIAFIFLLLHPILLLGTYSNLTFGNAVYFFTPNIVDWAKNWGIFSLALMVLLIVLTLYLRPKYHIWKWTHKFMGLAFFFGAVHAFLIPSDIAVFMPLRIYILLIFIFGIFSFIYHTVFGHFLIKKYKYIVSSIRVLGNNITEISLSPKGEKINFTPGQFAFVSFYDKNVKKESHPFSLSSPSGQDVVSFTAKQLGDYTNTLPQIKVGARALIEGPFGKFSFEDAKYKKQIWVAGGIGITPFLSMIDSVSKKDEYFVDFYYCLKSEIEAVHLKYLKGFENSRIRIIVHYTESSGFINADIIQKKSSGLNERDIFICAPPGMIRSLRKQFLTCGVDRELIHSEEFNLQD